VIAPQGEFQSKCRRLIALILREKRIASADFVIPSAPPVMQLHYKNFRKILSAAPHHLHPNSRILLKANLIFSAPEGRKIRLFYYHRKWCVPEVNTPFPASAVAEGITH